MTIFVTFIKIVIKNRQGCVRGGEGLFYYKVFFRAVYFYFRDIRAIAHFFRGVFVTHHAVGEVSVCVGIRDKAGVAFFDGFFVFLFVIHQL